MRKFNYVGDAHVITGEVTGKRVEDGRFLVDVEFRATNQRDVVTAPGERDGDASESGARSGVAARPAR